MKSHTGPIKPWGSSHSPFISVSLLLTVLQPRHAILCVLYASPTLGLWNLLSPLTAQSLKATVISPSSEYWLPSENISYVYSLSCLHLLAYQLHKERTWPSLFPALYSLPGTEQKAGSTFQLNEWMIEGKTPPTWSCLKYVFQVQRNTIGKHRPIL